MKSQPGNGTIQQTVRVWLHPADEIRKRWRHSREHKRQRPVKRAI